MGNVFGSIDSRSNSWSFSRVNNDWQNVDSKNNDDSGSVLFPQQPVIGNAKPTKSVRERYNEIKRSDVKEFSRRRDNGCGGRCASGKDLLSKTIEGLLNNDDTSDEAVNKKELAKALIIEAARLRYLFSLNLDVNNGEIYVRFEKLGCLCKELGVEISDMLKFMKNGSSIWSASVPRHLRNILWSNFGSLDLDVQDWLKVEYPLESDFRVNSSKTERLKTERVNSKQAKSKRHYNQFIKPEINKSSLFNDILETKDYLEGPLFETNHTERFDTLINDITITDNKNRYTVLVQDFLDEYVKHHKSAYFNNKKPVLIDINFITDHLLYKNTPLSLKERICTINVDPLSDGINLDVITGEVRR